MSSLCEIIAAEFEMNVINTIYINHFLKKKSCYLTEISCCHQKKCDPLRFIHNTCMIQVFLWNNRTLDDIRACSRQSHRKKAPMKTEFINLTTSGDDEWTTKMRCGKMRNCRWSKSDKKRNLFCDWRHEMIIRWIFLRKAYAIKMLAPTKNSNHWHSSWRCFFFFIGKWAEIAHVS